MIASITSKILLPHGLQFETLSEEPLPDKDMSGGEHPEGDAGKLGCNSIDIFFVPEPGPSHVRRSFDTCLNLQCSSTAVVPELDAFLSPKFKMSIELRPRNMTFSIASGAGSATP